jgi:hypothetical protein
MAFIASRERRAQQSIYGARVLPLMNVVRDAVRLLEKLEPCC